MTFRPNLIILDYYNNPILLVDDDSEDSDTLTTDSEF